LGGFYKISTSGNAVIPSPKLHPIKCGGALKKIMYFGARSISESRGIREKRLTSLCTSGHALFSEFLIVARTTEQNNP